MRHTHLHIRDRESLSETCQHAPISFIMCACVCVSMRAHVYRLRCLCLWICLSKMYVYRCMNMGGNKGVCSEHVQGVLVGHHKLMEEKHACELVVKHDHASAQAASAITCTHKALRL